MENTITKRAGRKEKPHQLADGTCINGLRKRANDGRWVVVSTGQMFTAETEELAVKKFRQLTGAVTESQQKRERYFADLSELFGYLPALAKTKEFWQAAAVELTARPVWCAQASGVERLGYLTDLEPPAPIPSLDQILTNWKEKATCDKQQIRKVARAFEDFIATTGIGGIEEFKKQTINKYQDAIDARDITGKQQQHLIGGIRRILKVAAKRFDCDLIFRKALTHLDSLQPSKKIKKTKLSPITAADWKKLLTTATGEDLAMILLMLNCGMYAGEVVRLQWDDVDSAGGTLVTNRKKTGEEIRAAVLWDETIAVLSSIERKGPYIFRGAGGRTKGTQLKKDGAFNRLRELATDAKCPDVDPSHIRDGAYTAAVAAGISEKLVNLFVGHSNGMDDHYVRASPEIVKPSCDAVYKRYFG